MPPHLYKYEEQDIGICCEIDIYVIDIFIISGETRAYVVCPYNTYIIMVLKINITFISCLCGRREE